MERSTAARVREILSSETVMSEFQLTSDFLDDVFVQMNTTDGDTYDCIKTISEVSKGLLREDDYVKLDSDWGIKLDSKNSNYISIPGCIAFTKDSFFIGDIDPLSPLAGCIFDTNLNFKGSVGKKGNDPEAGNVVAVNDFKYSSQSQCYYLLDTTNNLVQVYRDSDKTYLYPLGNGISGAAPGQLDTPVSVCIGSNGFVYVLCQEGQPEGATHNNGFLTIFDSTGVFKSSPLYQGKTNASGTCFSGEISLPKDMVIVSEAGTDKLYILNGNSEVGVFNTKNWLCEKVYNIPASLGNGLTANKIAVDETLIYLVSAESGQIIALNKADGTLYGRFGTLADESNASAKKSLGNFNGLVGIAVRNNQIYTVESTNKRLQAYGKDLLKNNSFYIIYQSYGLPNHKHLYKLTSSIQGGTIKNCKLIVNGTDEELSVQTGIDRGVRSFKVKIYLDPSQFNMINKTVDIDPIFILTKEFK